MQEQIYALGMVFLEMLFLFVALVALYNQRRVIGQGAFSMAVGLLLFFNCLLNAAEIRLMLWNGLSFSVGEVAIYLPVLTAFMMVYIISGVLAAQQLLLGSVILFLLFVYFTHITGLQCEWEGFWIFAGLRGRTVNELLASGRTTVNGNAVRHLLEFLCGPLIYSVVFSWRSSRRLAIPAALLGSQLIGGSVTAAILLTSGGDPSALMGDIYAMLTATVILSLLLIIYLDQLELEQPAPRGGRWDFLFAFFGSYGRMQELETNLKEWEARHQQLLHHTAEAVVMCDSHGRIINANISAGKLFNTQDPGKLNGLELFSLLVPEESEEEISFAVARKAPLYFRCQIRHDKDDNGIRTLAASLSPIFFHKQNFFLLIGRDITGELQLAAEKEALIEQLNHSQRLESLGMLAGGIAHDFNNYIHAILGHVDAATIIDRNDPEALNGHLNKIGAIAENAGKLTGQMLGFARKGKYHVIEVDVTRLIENCKTLLGPKKLNGIDFRTEVPAGKWHIAADLLQIQQVMMNLLLNAADALSNAGEKQLVLAVSQAAAAPLEFQPPPEFAGVLAEKFLCISVRDTGCGMAPEVAKRIFEPFFTTKPVGVGTGMGLSMVYGIIANHKGWVQFETSPGAGTTFCLFLPFY